MILRVTPKVLPLTVTFANSQELSTEIQSKIGGKMIVDAELSVSGTVANAEGNTPGNSFSTTSQDGWQ